MKKTGRIILTAAMIATTLVGCNSNKKAKEQDMKKQDQEEIIVREPVCIYGPPEMLDPSYKNRRDEVVVDEDKSQEEKPVIDEQSKDK